MRHLLTPVDVRAWEDGRSIALGSTVSPMAKVMISVPDELLERVDAAAEEAGETRSRFVRDALRARLASGGATVEGRRAAARRLRTALGPAGPAAPTDPVADIRGERSAH